MKKSLIIRIIAFSLLGGLFFSLSCDLFGPSTLNIKGLWCRIEGSKKVCLVCNGRGTHWIHRLDNGTNTTTVDGETYEVIRENGENYFH